MRGEGHVTHGPFWGGTPPLNSVLLCRRYSLSGVSLRPTWISSVSEASAQNRVGFSLQLMTGRTSRNLFIDPSHYRMFSPASCSSS